MFITNLRKDFKRLHFFNPNFIFYLTLDAIHTRIQPVWALSFDFDLLCCLSISLYFNNNNNKNKYVLYTQNNVPLHTFDRINYWGCLISSLEMVFEFLWTHRNLGRQPFDRINGKVLREKGKDKNGDRVSLVWFFLISSTFMWGCFAHKWNRRIRRNRPFRRYIFHFGWKFYTKRIQWTADTVQCQWSLCSMNRSMIFDWLPHLHDGIQHSIVELKEITWQISHSFRNIKHYRERNCLHVNCLSDLLKKIQCQSFWPISIQHPPKK